MDNITSDFGCLSIVRFLNESNVTAYDTEGNILYCACGNKSGIGFVGKEGHVNMCSKCYQKTIEKEV